MGNKPAKQNSDEILVRVMPPLDRAFVRWLAQDVRRLHDFAPRNPRAIKPPDHYIEYMRLYGWMDLDINDPDLAQLINYGLYWPNYSSYHGEVSSLQDLAPSGLDNSTVTKDITKAWLLHAADAPTLKLAHRVVASSAAVLFGS